MASDENLWPQARAALETQSWKSPSTRAWKFCRVRTLTCFDSCAKFICDWFIIFKPEHYKFWWKCSIGDTSFIRKREHYFKKNLTCRESLGLHIWIYILFISLTLYFDGKFSSVSMASRPPTISKTIKFWSSTLLSWRHSAGTYLPITLQSMTTTCR